MSWHASGQWPAELKSLEIHFGKQNIKVWSQILTEREKMFIPVYFFIFVHQMYVVYSRPGGWESEFLEDRKAHVQNMVGHGWWYQGFMPSFRSNVKVLIQNNSSYYFLISTKTNTEENTKLADPVFMILVLLLTYGNLLVHNISRSIERPYC